MKIPSKKLRFTTYPGYALIILCMLIFSSINIYSQVVIKEKVEINPNSTQLFHSGLSKTIYDDPESPLYLRYGGELILYKGIYNSFFNLDRFGWELWIDPIGKISLFDENNLLVDTVKLGYFNQWDKLIFHINKEGSSVPSYQLSGGFFGNKFLNDTFIEFYLDHRPGTPLPEHPNYQWILELKIDYTNSVFPPQVVLSDEWISNPFEPPEQINIPATGKLNSEVFNSNPKNDQLVFETDVDKYTIEDIASHSYSTVNITNVKKSDKAQIYITSKNPVVSGMKLYPMDWYFDYQDYNGDIVTTDIQFENGTDLLFDDLTMKLRIKPDDPSEFESIVSVKLEPSELSPGDTAKVILKKRLTSGEIISFPRWDLFDIEIMEGNEYGSLSWEYFENTDILDYVTADGILFIADSSISKNSVEVLFRAIHYEDIILGSIDPSSKSQQKIKSSNNNNVPQKDDNANLNSEGNPQIGFGKILIRKEETANKIMLGETKYFGVKKKEKDGKVEEIKIMEIKAKENTFNPPDNLPVLSDGWKWVEEDSIWSKTPITVKKGKRSGVFYDRFYGDIKASGTETEAEVLELKEKHKGLLRVIGQFWETDTTYSVILKTNSINNYPVDSLEIKVVRPDKLGDEYNKVKGIEKDSFGNYTTNVEFDLDSLIIYNCGKYGILPQIVKGIIHKESVGFKPSYRYEPYSDFSNKRRFFKKNKYWIKDSTDEGTPKIPDHGIVYLGDFSSISKYPGYINAWEMFNEYENLYFYKSATDSSKYVIKNSNGKIIARSLYKSQNERLKTYLNGALNDLVKNRRLKGSALKDSAAVLAGHRYRNYLRYKINNNMGMINNHSQTRIFASYGLMQLTYNNGVRKFKNKMKIYNYPKNNKKYLPEDINVTDINIEYGIKHFAGIIRNFLGNYAWLLTSVTWPKERGLEKSYWWALKNYNGGKNYPNPVFNFSKQYFPKKEN